MKKPDIRAFIARWYLNGKSAAQIARQLSRLAGRKITRNAVIGLARRMREKAQAENPIKRIPSHLITLPNGTRYNTFTRRIESDEDGAA
jgi:hypothetical protein